MAQGYSITVDTGGRGRTDLAAFLRDAGRARSALDGMKDSVRAVRSGLEAAARGVARLGDCAKGALSALMQASNLAQGLETGVMDLYRWSRTWWKSFAGALDSLATSALYLKNSLAAMAAPLVGALAPAIDYVTDRLVGLFNLVGQLFARLTGSATYVAAKKTGDAWDSVSGRISKATSALRRYISGFDQLNVLTDGSSGGGSGGSGGGGGAGSMFEEREIESGLAAFADSLKAAFLASDWQALGTLLGEKVNELVDRVDWAGVGEKFGFYLNGAVQTAYYLLDSVNFTNIGARIAQFLNSALAEIDFSTVGGTVALFFTSLAETLAGFAETFDWAGFAGKAADGVNGFASQLGARLDAIDWAGLALRLTDGLNTFIADTDWDLAGRTFAGRVNDLLAVLGTSAASFDWSGAGKALAASVNGLFKRVDWDGLGRWLNDTLTGVLDFGLAFVEGFDAAGFADGVGKALSRVDWEAISEKLWQLFSAALKKLGETVGTLLFGGSADVGLNLSLLKKGWTSVANWLGIESPLSALIELARDGWTTIAAFVGNIGTKSFALGKDGWTTISAFIGTASTVAISLSKNGWSTIANYVGTAVTVAASLSKKDKNQTPDALFGTGLTVSAKLKNANEKKYTLKKIFGTSITVTATLAKKVGGLSGWVSTVSSALSKAVSKIKGKAGGGAITAGGREIAFARGGVIRGGLARYLSSVPHYASGTTRAHGTVFVAGEAGPEIMGHINGRTEILNKSQLAQAIYGAVVAGMGKAVNALGAFLSNRMAECANAIVETVGNVGEGIALPDLSGLSYHAPAMATGTVMPYEVAAQVARSGADIQNTLDANNEDLIQTIISVAGQLVAAVQSAGRTNRQTGVPSGLSAREVIDQINRNTRMFGASPIEGV